MTPLLQKELEDFKGAWNRHSIRKNHLTHLPEGVPNDLYKMPNPGSYIIIIMTLFNQSSWWWCARICILNPLEQRAEISARAN